MGKRRTEPKPRKPRRRSPFQMALDRMAELRREDGTLTYPRIFELREKMEWGAQAHHARTGKKFPVIHIVDLYDPESDDVMIFGDRRQRPTVGNSAEFKALMLQGHHPDQS